MTCRAAPRSYYNDPGWTCTGENLTIVGTWTNDGVTVPIVMPTALLHRAHEGLPMRLPFTGGDHLHAVIREEP